VTADTFPDADTDPLVDLLIAEAARSWEVYGHYRSAHEAYGVLAEETLELLQAIHANDDDAAQREALQVAAVAFRFAAQGWRREG